MWDWFYPPSQLWLICRAVWISRSWLTSRLLTSAHSSCRNWDTRGVKRGKGPGFVANGLNPVEYLRARGANMLKVGVGDASLYPSEQREKREVNSAQFNTIWHLTGKVRFLPWSRRSRGYIRVIRWYIHCVCCNCATRWNGDFVCRR